MDWFAILDRYGIAVAMSIGMAFYIFKSTFPKPQHMSRKAQDLRGLCDCPERFF